MSPAGIALRERELGSRRPVCISERIERDRSSGQPAADGPVTLEDLLTTAWSELRSGAAVACPLCAGSMEPRWTAGAGVAGGRCRSCGTELA